MFAHIAWTTRDRAHLIDAPLAGFLADLFPITCRQERANLLELGMVRTHVHMLVRLHPTTQIPRLLQRLKGASAVLSARKDLPKTGRTLRWAKGYNIESVSPRAIGSVQEYVRTQAIRHPSEVIPNWPAKPDDETRSDSPGPCGLAGRSASRDALIAVRAKVAISDTSRDAAISRGKKSTKLVRRRLPARCPLHPDREARAVDPDSGSSARLEAARRCCAARVRRAVLQLGHPQRHR